MNIENSYKKRKYVTSTSLMLLVGFVIMIVGCDVSAPKASSDHISDTEIIQLINKNHENSEMTLMDLRTPGEIKATGAIPGAMTNDFLSAEFEPSLKELDKSKTYIVYCKAGGRSAKAAAKMKKLGFKVKDYSEGMNGWLSKKHKTSMLSQ